MNISLIHTTPPIQKHVENSECFTSNALERDYPVKCHFDCIESGQEKRTGEHTRGFTHTPTGPQAAEREHSPLQEVLGGDHRHRSVQLLLHLWLLRWMKSINGADQQGPGFSTERKCACGKRKKTNTHITTAQWNKWSVNIHNTSATCWQGLFLHSYATSQANPTS